MAKANASIGMITPVNFGDSQLKASKVFGASKSPVSDNLKGLSEDSDKLFSQKLKEITIEDAGVSKKIRTNPRDEGLQPVRPKLEKQGGVGDSCVSTDKVSSEEVTDNQLQNVTVKSDADSDGENLTDDSSLTKNGSLTQNVQPDFDNVQNKETQTSDENVVNVLSDSSEDVSDVNNQSLLLQLQGIFVPKVNLNVEQIELNEDSDKEVEGIDPIPADSENKSDLGFTNASDVNGNALSEGLKTEKTDENNLPLQNGSDENSDKANAPKSERNDINDLIQNGLGEDSSKVNAPKSEEADSNDLVHKVKGSGPYHAELYNGTLAELIKQGGITFGNIITFTVTDNGLFIGNEGDSSEDASNFVDGDFLQKLFDVLSQRLEKGDEPTASKQLRQLILKAVQKVVSDMHDPVKKEEEYQQKLVEFLMKFVDRINGKDDDKKTALKDDKDENKEGLLLQLIDNLVEASKENAKEDKKEYTAAIYLYGAEIGLWTPGDSYEEGYVTDTEGKIEPAAAVEQVADAPKINNNNYIEMSGVEETEIKNAAEVKNGAESGIPAEHRTEEKAAVYKPNFNTVSDVPFNSEVKNSEAANTAVNVERTVEVSVQSNGAVEAVNAVRAEKPIELNAQSNGAVEAVNAVNAEKPVEVNAQSNGAVEAVNSVSAEKPARVSVQNSSVVEAVNAVKTDKNIIEIDGSKAQRAENTSKVNTQNVTESVQAVGQKALEISGESFQIGTDKGKKSAVPANLRFKHKVIGASEELGELQRLFGVKNRDDEKMKEMNELKSESDENSERNQNTEKTVAAKEDQGLLKSYNSKSEDESNNSFDKSVIESVTIEALKADNAVVAKAYTPGENGAKQIMTQIISEMLNSLSHNGGTGKTVTTLTMTLNPESLGKITMKVSEEAGKISLLVTAHNKETAEILSQRMDAMQQAAKDSGTQLEKYQVVYAPGEDSRAGQQNYDGSSKNPYVRQDNEENQKGDNDSQFAELLKQAV